MTTIEIARHTTPSDRSALWDDDRAAGDATPDIRPDVRRLCSTVAVPGPPWVSAALADARAFAQFAVSLVGPTDRVLDLGTGTGLLAICLAKLDRPVVATDISASAVRTARRNARRNGVTIECYRSDLLESVTGRFDLIAFNPPYNIGPDTFLTNLGKNLVRRLPWVRRRANDAVPSRVVAFHQKLLTRLLQQAPDHLTPGGALLLHVCQREIGRMVRVLPAGATVRVLCQGDLTALGTAALLVRLD